MPEILTSEYVSPSVALGSPYTPAEMQQIAKLQTEIVWSWPSYEALLAKLPESEQVYLGPDGRYYHDINRGTGEQVLRDNRLYDRKVVVTRLVVLSRAESLKLLDTGVHSDHWNGWTWLMDGHKLGKHPHEDIASNRNADTSFLEESPPADQALIAAAQSARAAIVAPLTHVHEIRDEPPAVIADDTRPPRSRRRVAEEAPAAEESE